MKQFSSLLLLFVCVVYSLSVQAQSFNREISGYTQSTPLVDFQNATSIATDPTNGTMYVLDSVAGNVQVFNSSGVYSGKWGWSGTGSGELNKPSDIAVSPDGSMIYVVDNGNNQVQIFGPGGNVVETFGYLGASPGLFISPTGIGVDMSSGNVYVSDATNRIQQFDQFGNFQAYWGGTGTGNGNFMGARGIAVDASGYVYVVDAGNSRIQKFSSSGSFVSYFGSAGTGPGQLAAPRDIAYDSGSDLLYITDAAAGAMRVSVWNSSGTYQTETGGNAGSGDGEFNFPHGITVYGSIFYVADANNKRIQYFNANYLGQWGQNGQEYGALRKPMAAVADASGFLYVLESANDRVQVFDGSGQFSTIWGLPGSGFGEFYLPTGIALDEPNGFIYIADAGNNRVQKFNMSGTYLSQWGTSGTGNGQFSQMGQLAVKDGFIYVVDGGNNRVQKFTSNGIFIKQFGGGNLSTPYGIGISVKGDIFISNASGTIAKYDTSGTYSTSWGSAGSANGQFNDPRGVSVDGGNYIYVADLGNNRIQVLDQNGVYFTSIGSKGIAGGSFLQPVDVSIGPSGQIYVTDMDMAHYSVSMFNPGGFPPQYSTTTWTSGGWNNGVPNPSTNVVITYPYQTDQSGGFFCHNLTITSTLRVTTGSTVNAGNDLANYGTVEVEPCCNFYYITASKLGTINNLTGQIKNPGINNGVTGQPYSFQMQGQNIAIPYWTASGLPPGLFINSSTGAILGTPTSAGTFSSVQINIAPQGCTTLVSSQTYTMAITNGPILPSPNLSVDDFPMTYGLPSKKPVINKSSDDKTYRVNTSSSATKYYYVSPSGSCVTVDTLSGKVTLSCAGSASSNYYQIMVVQEANTQYTADTAYASLTVYKQTAKLSADKTSLLISDPNPVIGYTTNSDNINTEADFQQTSDSSVAIIDHDGTVSFTGTAGTFSFALQLFDTDRYTGNTINVTVQVAKDPLPPVAENDTIQILVGEEVNIDILQNDIGIMGPIDTTKVDIDMENPGVQNKYLEPSSGSFVFNDSTGLLEYKPFEGALGLVKLSYTVTDNQKNTSSPATIFINIVQPGGQPALKATELITPNNDGLNDAFVIGYVDRNKSNFLKIFDRNGSVLFSADNYQNDWEGTYHSGKALENGVYFYLFNENSGEKELKGMIEIRR